MNGHYSIVYEKMKILDKKNLIQRMGSGHKARQVLLVIDKKVFANSPHRLHNI